MKPRRPHSFVVLESLEQRQLLSSTLWPFQSRHGSRTSRSTLGDLTHHGPALSIPAAPIIMSLHPPTLLLTPAPGAQTPAPAAAKLQPLITLQPAAALQPAIITPAALTAPAASLVGASANEIDLAATAPTGGSGAYTYQWYRGTSAGFTPSTATLLPNATSLTLADTAGLAPDTPYFYILAASDGVSTLDSNQVIGALRIPTIPITLPYQSGPVFLAYLGSSTWAINQGSGQVPIITGQDLQTAFPTAGLTTFDGAVGGTTSTSYLPGTTLSNNIKAAVMAASGFKILRLMIGSNDAAAGTPVSAWLGNLQAIINDALTWPVDRIVLEEIGVRLDGGNATLDLIRQYNAARASLLGPKVVLGTAPTYENQALNLATLSADNIHQTNAGQIALAANQATELNAVFTVPPPPPPPSGITTNLSGTMIYADLGQTGDQPGAGAITLTGTTAPINSWTISGSTLILILSGRVARGDTITLQIPAGAILDAAGNPLPLMSFPVINDSLVGVFQITPV